MYFDFGPYILNKKVCASFDNHGDVSIAPDAERLRPLGDCDVGVFSGAPLSAERGGSATYHNQE